VPACGRLGHGIDVLTDAEDSLRFGQFELRRKQRALLAGGVPVALGSRAFDILCALVDEAGKVISKEEVLAKVWPSTYVVEGSLRVHMAGLRKALGDGRNGQRYIINIPMRGYSFVAPIERIDGEAPAGPVPSAPRRDLSSLPTPLHRIVGRDQDAEALREQLERQRLVTLVGAAGIGKTTLAVSIAATLVDQPARANWIGVRFVDLALLSNPQLVAGALASTLGIASLVGNALPSLLAFLHDKALLILFDNCEHVLAEVAALSEAILRGAPGVHILATSREPLRADGERVYHLQPLAVPDAHLALTAETAMRQRCPIRRSSCSSSVRSDRPKRSSCASTKCRRSPKYAVASMGCRSRWSLQRRASTRLASAGLRRPSTIALRC
jgi:DNA-binding winged helix-turn-helix (wHTH) protein